MRLPNMNASICLAVYWKLDEGYIPHISPKAFMKPGKYCVANPEFMRLPTGSRMNARLILTWPCLSMMLA